MILPPPQLFPLDMNMVPGCPHHKGVPQSSKNWVAWVSMLVLVSGFCFVCFFLSGYTGSGNGKVIKIEWIHYVGWQISWLNYTKNLIHTDSKSGWLAIKKTLECHGQEKLTHRMLPIKRDLLKKCNLLLFKECFINVNKIHLVYENVQFNYILTDFFICWFCQLLLEGFWNT